MRLTLPQRLYPLTHTVDGKFEAVNLQGRGQLLRAGALAEPAFAGQLSTAGGKALRSAGEPPADVFWAQVWRDLPADRPKHRLQFERNKAATAKASVCVQLAGADAIPTDPRQFTWPPATFAAHALEPLHRRSRRHRRLPASDRMWCPTPDVRAGPQIGRAHV